MISAFFVLAVQTALVVLVAGEVLAQILFKFRSRRTSIVESERLNDDTPETLLAAEKARFKRTDSLNFSSNPFGYPMDFAGNYLNVRAGRRITTNQPSNFVGEVICLGGSTTFCGDTTDSDTWPSVLQRRISALNIPLKVENYGRNGATAINRIGLLPQLIERHNTRLVVLFFGANDSGGQRLRDLVGLPWHVRLVALLPFKLTRIIYMHAFSRFFQEIGRRTASDTAQRIIRVHRELDSIGIQLLVVLQPHFWINHSIPNAIRTFGMRNPFHARRDLLVSLEHAYSHFISELAQAGINFRNLSQLFSIGGKDSFVDWVHCNSRGNLLIGEQIAISVMELTR